MDERRPLEYYLALEYPYTVKPNDGSWFITFPDLPGCMTQVEDSAEISAMAEEIRQLWIEGEYEDGHSIPEPGDDSRYSGKFVLRLPKRLHAELAVAAERNGSSLNAYLTSLLAERYVLREVDSRLAAIEDHLERADQALSQVAETAAHYRT